MERKEYIVPICVTTTTTAPEAQRKLEMSLSTVKIEMKEDVGRIDLEQSDHSSYMYTSDPLESSVSLNYNDSKDHVLKQVKKELLEDEFLQTDHSINSKDTDLITFVKIQKEDSVKEVEEILINSMEEYQVSLKIESLEMQDISDNAGNTNIHYNVLVAPQRVHCKLCGRKFKNRFSLIKHNIVHIEVVVNKTDINEMYDFHQNQNCDKHFDNFEDMLSHVSDVHSKEKVKAYTDNTKFQCEYCGQTFKIKGDLARHTKIMHYKYNNFKCWCGKLFNSSTLLNEHNSLEHQCDMTVQFKCNSCPKTFAKRRSLTDHTKRVHYEYGRAFKCWCGKEFRTPMQLYEHKKRHPLGKNINNAYNRTFQCEYCQKRIKSKRSLLGHIENLHLNKARAFENRCKEKLRDSMRSQRDANNKDPSINRLQCDYCQKFFKRKRSLVMHIRGSHYDYGKKMFKCWCGKRYRTPLHLYWHSIRSHKQDSAKSQNNNESGRLLIRHIENNSYNNGKVFECWCGKQFRSVKLLLEHKKRQHKANIKDTNEIDSTVA